MIKKRNKGENEYRWWKREIKVNKLRTDDKRRELKIKKNEFRW